ncbi:hypothetical protein DKK70_00875 [Gilliamella apicola]|uniref:Uncharacterized protein n=1 Tax=Gilliamella apicola TaxID=1196095 RepID=A0A2V4EK41_9GAMM|nr:restriction endonuclease fold toxin [Gilliamella apicola]PXZ08697.1 hypothetical protein DKK70_00875 [Gilliamella apicola]
MIASEADDTRKNRLDTGTISFSDIENKADFNVTHVSVSGGTGGPGMPTAYQNSNSASSTTKSAVEQGQLIIRNQDKQQQNIADLSRDTESANNPLKQIFDKQKELDKIETVELIKDIAQQAKSITQKYDRIQAQKDIENNKELLSKAEALKQYNDLSDEDKAKISFEEFYTDNQDYWYYAAVDTQLEANKQKGNNIGTMGNDFSKGVDSAVSIITSIITGDITGGLAGASAPWLAEQIKLHTGHMGEDGKWQTDDIAGNLIAHAILGAVVAELQGNSGLAGGAGAVTGEVAADIIRKQLYGKEVKDLTEDEKQTISALSQLAAGLAVAAGGGSVGDAGAAINSSKNAVENNFLSNKYGVEKLDEKGKALYKKLKDAGIGDIDELQAKFEECNGNSDCERDVRNEFREQERKAGEILTQLYQTGQLSREEFEYLNSYYAEAMMYGAGEGQKLHNTGFNLAGEIYDLSGHFWTPMGLISDSYLSAIRYDIMIEDWKAEGLSNEEIQSKLLKLNIIDSGIAPVNVNALLNLYDNGASKDQIMAFASTVIFNKLVGKASNAAGKGTGAATQSNNKYSGGLVKVNKPDAAADALAQRIGGVSRVRFANDGREFDCISDMYIAQTKPALQQLNKSVRVQMKATFEAAKDTNRSVYYHFEGQPSQSVINKLNEYSNRYGVKVVIDTKPLNPK